MSDQNVDRISLKSKIGDIFVGDFTSTVDRRPKHRPLRHARLNQSPFADCGSRSAPGVTHATAQKMLVRGPFDRDAASAGPAQWAGGASGCAPTAPALNSPP